MESGASMSERHVIGEMSITDEQEVMDVNIKMKTIVDRLSQNPTTALLMQSKGEGVVGVITSEDLHAAMQAGVKMKKMKPKDLMRTNLLQIVEDTDLSEALDAISQQAPDAVIVQNVEGGFAGFFSPGDYEEATDIVEAQRLAQQSFNQNAEDFQDNIAELMMILLADNEETEEEEVSVDRMELSSEQISLEDD